MVCRNFESIIPAKFTVVSLADIPQNLSLRTFSKSLRVQHPTRQARLITLDESTKFDLNGYSQEVTQSKKMSQLLLEITRVTEKLLIHTKTSVHFISTYS